MEAKRRINLAGVRKTAIFLTAFALFVTVNAKAGLLAPSLSVSPSATNVSKGDTVTISVQSSVTVGVLSSLTCQFNGGALPANVSFTSVGGGSLLDLGGSVNAILTITNMSGATAGTYTFSASAVAAGSGMIQNGFKIQFSAPTGSNLVIQASSDMKNWTSVYTNVVTGGSL